MHRLCSMIVGASVADAEQCMKIREGLHNTDHCVYPKFCPCPFASPVNTIVYARRIGLPIVEAHTGGSPGTERAAREAGLGILHEGVSHREVYGEVPRHVVLFDQTFWDEPATWWEPPATVVIDVVRSFREGRVTPCLPQDEAREAWQLLLDAYEDLGDRPS